VITFYLTGQKTFGNRGCEAIVRSTKYLLEKEFGSVKFLIPSDNVKRDASQWVGHREDNIVFTKVYYSFLTRVWGVILLIIPRLIKKNFPLPIPRQLKRELMSVDAILSIGGDNYSYYSTYPVWQITMDRYAYKLKKPVYLWGASIGPFSKKNGLSKFMFNHLSNFTQVLVREECSLKYLSESMEVKNVSISSDPAFFLKKQKNDVSDFWPESDCEGVMGFNVSYFANINKHKAQELVNFLMSCFFEKKMSILLIPHVTPLSNNIKNNDFIFMLDIYRKLKKELGDYVSICPDGLNAAQTKYVISKCRFLFAARTHATIASLSMFIPTISIAYSQKAIGLNLYIFGHDNWVLKNNELSACNLKNKLDSLIREENVIKEQLKKRVPELKRISKDSAGLIKRDLS
jgi:colanic acid/amylovoran biosynthesis protein